MKRKILISVVGSHNCNKEVEQKAHKIGEIIAAMGAVLICGGLGGVMEASSKGAKSTGGLTIGILPGKNREDANPYIDIALPTSIGYTRNSLVASCADILIALPGSYGTNCEICYGLIFGRPVFDLGNWNIEGMIKVENLKDFKQELEKIIRKIQ